MKFNNYLLLEMPSVKRKGYSTILSEREAEKILYTNCSNAVETKFEAYRTSKSKDEFRLVDPTQGTRVARGTKSNFHTLFVDNLSEWEKFPKRSKSLIFSKYIFSYFGYNSIYRVFPFNGSKIAICPNSDFWFSFPGGIKSFNIFLGNIFKKYLGERLKKNITWEELKQKIDALEEIVKKQYDKGETELIEKFRDRYLVSGSGISIWKIIIKFFSPEKFKLETMSKSLKIPSGFVEPEMWTDGKCLLILNSLNNRNGMLKGIYTCH